MTQLSRPESRLPPAALPRARAGRGANSARRSLPRQTPGFASRRARYREPRRRSSGIKLGNRSGGRVRPEGPSGIFSSKVRLRAPPPPPPPSARFTPPLPYFLLALDPGEWPGGFAREKPRATIASREAASGGRCPPRLRSAFPFPPNARTEVRLSASACRDSFPCPPPSAPAEVEPCPQPRVCSKAPEAGEGGGLGLLPGPRPEERRRPGPGSGKPCSGGFLSARPGGKQVLVPGPACPWRRRCSNGRVVSGPILKLSPRQV